MKREPYAESTRGGLRRRAAAPHGRKQSVRTRLHYSTKRSNYVIQLRLNLRESILGSLSARATGALKSRHPNQLVYFTKKSLPL